MVIYPISRNAQGIPTRYASSAVHTTLNGQRTRVSSIGYTGPTIASVIAQAVGNAGYIHQREYLRKKMCVKQAFITTLYV
jgi:hypothetical protein